MVGAGLLLSIALTGLGPAPAASAASPAPRPADTAAPAPRVVIVSIPRLGWEDVTPTNMATVTEVADRGAVGSLSVKTIGRRTSAAEGYASIATGARATAPDGAQASGYGRSEVLPSGQTALTAQAAAGHPAGRAEVLVPGIDTVADANGGTHQGAETGALGRALHAGGWRTAVVANHDGRAGQRDRTAAVAMADPSGRVDLGSVSTGLTDAPAGDALRRTDLDALAQAVSALPPQRVAALVEIGDVAWADDAHAAPAARRQAVRRADRALARVLGTLDPTRDVVMVLSPVAPVAFERPTPFVIAGPGITTGLATSATTRRPGYVTLPDIGPTVLDRAGRARSTAMSGTPITAKARTTSGAQRISAAREAIAETRFIDRAAGTFIVSYPIVFESWSFLVLLLLAARHQGERAPRVTRWLGPVVVWIGVVISVVPVLALLLGGATLRSWHLPIWFTVLWLLGGAVGLAALGAARGLTARSRLASRGPWLAVVVTAAFTWLVLVIDVLTGARLQFDTPLGNSPTGAGRFSGVGNLAFGLLAASTLLLAWTIAAELTRRGRRSLGVTAAAALFAVALVVDGAPGLGSDVGGALVLTPVAVVSCWLLAGRRLSWRPIAVGIGGAAAAVAVFGLIDLTRPASDRTHFGRLLAGDDHSRDVIIRKAIAAGGSLLGAISLAFILFCVVVLAVAFWRVRRSEVLATFAPGSTARQLLVTASVLGVAAGALNDSGVMVPAIMAAILVPAAVALLLTPAEAPRSHPTSKWEGQGSPQRPLKRPVRMGGGS